MKFRQSLLAKYLIVVVVAILLLPLSIPTLSILLYMPPILYNQGLKPHEGPSDFEKKWHQQAKTLEGASDEEVNASLLVFQQRYPHAELFWVDESGETKASFPRDETLPKRWTVAQSIQFMKDSFDSDPFTVVAFIGENQSNGFMVLKMDREHLKLPIERLGKQYEYIFTGVVLLVMFLFIFCSWIFFQRIRKRLVRLQHAMEEKGANGIPHPVERKELDEIGQLEESFNVMIIQLEDSQRRYQEEETLRRELIMNLSHDLRTPLTALGAHAYSLQKEELSENGRESLELIDHKVQFISHLMDNLLSYTLLSSGKYLYEPKRTDMGRLIRQFLVGWYPIFEEKNFDIDVWLPEEKVEWTIDSKWMERILDNLLQNINRHAAEGKYVRVSLTKTTLTVADKGNGFLAETTEKGAGVGLAVVDMMVNDMELTWRIDSHASGTTIYIENHIER
ncbi:HAMP domain-containing sensor histidine kinase [Bacillus sp. CGMCC 1.16541]|uniref:HAMP domain-containing sensor histidine kinase n=1 Tax=Bacillus sp. CGMCC 1.16541 TaxID=2185143 RepID=UPI000D73797B|nr:HAMP domain-containing sensor histidine kinase [Bacillus sp. CGMCC 1.16541]